MNDTDTERRLLAVLFACPDEQRARMLQRLYADEFTDEGYRTLFEIAERHANDWDALMRCCIQSGKAPDVAALWYHINGKDRDCDFRAWVGDHQILRMLHHERVACAV